MNIFRISSVFFLAILFIFSVQKTFAHDGGQEHEKIKAEEPASIESMYSVKENEVDPISDSSDSLDNIFSPTDLFTQDELVDPIDDKHMGGSHNEHAGPQVELSRHERVSSSSKGFGTAVGITVFVGLAFAGLTFRRPGE
jgi:hypothetical protein